MEAPVQPAALPQEPDPILLPARTRVVAKQEPLAEPKIAKVLAEPKIATVSDEPLVDAVPLWFEQEWADQEWPAQEWDPTEPSETAGLSANSENRNPTSAPEPNFVWTESERVPRALPSDTPGMDHWWEQRSATRN
jgi:hypothetical protein